MDRTTEGVTHETRGTPVQFAECTQTYLSERDLSSKYAKELLRRTAALEQFVGRSLDIADLTDQLLNSFLGYLKDKGYSPRSRCAYRDSICAVWRDAWETGKCPRRPERTKRIRIPKSAPKGWSIEDLRHLVAATQDLPGRIVHLPALTKAIWFTALVRLLWDTGIRIGDALAAKWADISDGQLILTQSKTGNWVARRLSPQTLAMLQEIHAKCGRDDLLPYDGSRTQVWIWLGRAVEAAGIRNGRTREIRRGSSSSVENSHPGRGGDFLGHVSERVFRESYRDPTIASPDVPSPPPLDEVA